MKQHLWLLILLLFTGCVTTSRPSNVPILDEKLSLKKVDFTDLKDWTFDDHEMALVSFKKSCKKFLVMNPSKKIGGFKNFAGYAKDWQDVCNVASKIDSSSAQEFFETNFSLYKIISDKKLTGLFTGYYEADLNGSLVKTDKYKYPIYKPPVNIKDNKHNLSRTHINNGSLDGKNLEILYVDDEVELFFTHIQGSARVHLTNGKTIRIGYTDKNNHPYKSIGNDLIKEFNIPTGKISADFIKNWLREDKLRGKKIMERNPSYVFFKIIHGQGPYGAQHVVLTPERSLAIDNRYLAYGLPLWLETLDYESKPFNKLLIAQDRGGAIKGVIRGDIYYGSGPLASKKASSQKQAGIYYVLLPKNTIVDFVLN
jgi:membrane-bound lytic murein transglycosylase A